MYLATQTELDSDIDSDTDSDTEEEEEEFQNLRHHRLIHDYHKSPAPLDTRSPVSTNDPAMTAYAHTTAHKLNRVTEPVATPEVDLSEPEPVVQYSMPTPPAIEEWNDIRHFYTSMLPLRIDNLNVQNCVECELLDAVIPRGDYVIHSRNQTFQVRQPFEASVQTFTDITIPIGDYSSSTLATQITNLVVAAGLASFSAATSTVTKNFTFFDDSVIDVSFNQELAYDLGWGETTILNLGSVQFNVDALASYVINSTNNTFEVSVSAGAYVEYTIAPGTYTASGLATAMDTAITTPVGLTAAYLSDGSATIALYHTTGNALDVRVGGGLADLWSSTVTKSSVYDSSISKYYATSVRADLYGSRYVEIRTDELNAPQLHRRGVLQATFLSNEITNWRANGSDTLRRRRFAIPMSLDKLTVSFKERHPSKSGENDFHDMELNGLAVSFSICFRRLRYQVEGHNTQLSMH